jgi:hypothetical protein
VPRDRVVSKASPAAETSSPRHAAVRLRTAGR